MLAGAGQPLEIARTLLALGTEQRRAKQRGAARESLQAAIAAFRELRAAAVGRAGRGARSQGSAGGARPTATS